MGAEGALSDIEYYSNKDLDSSVAETQVKVLRSFDFERKDSTLTIYEKHVDRTVDVQSKKKFEAVREFFDIVKGRHEWVRILQSWEGRVTSVDEKNSEFTAILSDRTNIENPEEEMVVDMAAINDGDKDLLEPGAVFYWNIGELRVNTQGTVVNHSDIRLRRLPSLSRVQLEKAKEAGRSIAERLHAD